MIAISDSWKENIMSSRYNQISEYLLGQRDESGWGCGRWNAWCGCSAGFGREEDRSLEVEKN